ncbi:MAG: exo-alpha-sialidase [Clostridiales bacterium]|nr:exo-alpha-sialidase [Candidatus Coliplasma caballi]
MKVINPEKTHGIVWRRKPEENFRYNGWPTVCKDENGVIYAAGSSFRITHVCPTGKNCLWISKDEGKTWSNPILLNDSILDDRDTGIVSLGNGKLLATWFSSFHKDYCEPLLTTALCDTDKAIVKGAIDAWKSKTTEELQSRVGAYVKTSEDAGMSWSDPILVPLTAPHGPVKAKNGNLFYLGKEMNGGYVWESPIVFYTSADDGLTWEKQGTVPFPEGITGGQFHEPHILELPGGRLLGAIRVEGLPVHPKATTYTTFSDDGGNTWSVPKPTGVCGMPPHLMLHSGGAVILSYACRIPGERCERAAVSYDGGETWEADYILDDRVKDFYDLGYPSSVELSDGSILTVYYQAYPGDPYTSFLYTKWKL